MRVFQFASARTWSRSALTPHDINRVLERVAEGTDTGNLVVSLYLLPGIHASRGTAYVHRWMTPDDFTTGRGNWNCTLRFGAPDSLPDRFKLIRMRLDPDPATYPRDERDGYRWLFRYGAFHDHLATLFGHELHHFRRHHLGMHPRAGEHAANRWALEQAVRLGYDVRGKPGPPARRRPVSQLSGLFAGRRKKTDPYAALRRLKAGERIRIDRDPRNRYAGEPAELVRPVRSNAKRMVIRTRDGMIWRWPLAWVGVFEPAGTPTFFNEHTIENQKNLSKPQRFR
ncbi:hypothetical protein JW777_11130 [bacterium]|nr:hypothetical protein [bacterium]